MEEMKCLGALSRIYRILLAESWLLTRKPWTPLAGDKAEMQASFRPRIKMTSPSKARRNRLRLANFLETRNLRCMERQFFEKKTWGNQHWRAIRTVSHRVKKFEEITLIWRTYGWRGRRCQLWKFGPAKNHVGGIKTTELSGLWTTL